MAIVRSREAVVDNIGDLGYSEEAEFQNRVQTLKEIILRHIRKISDLSIEEFTGGYWQKRPIKTQGGIMFTEEYHKDMREAYSNAIDFLIDIIYPMGDDVLRKFIDANDKEEFKDIEDKQIPKEKMKVKRKIFKEINKMFERINFFKGEEGSNE